MPRFITWAATTILLLAFAAGVATAQQETPQQLSISGVVRYTDGSVVPQYVVQWESAADKSVAGAAVTDTAGRYRIPNLAPGTYLVGFLPPMFVPDAEKAQLEERTDVSPELAKIGRPLSRRVVLTPGSPRDDVDFVILPQTGFPKIEEPDVALPRTGAASPGADAVSGERWSEGRWTVGLAAIAAVTALFAVGLGAARVARKRP